LDLRRIGIRIDQRIDHWEKREQNQRRRISRTHGLFKGYDGKDLVIGSEDDGGQNTYSYGPDRAEGRPSGCAQRSNPPSQGSCRINDIYPNGTVRELALHRAEYAAKIERLRLMLHALEEKIEALASGMATD